MTYEPKFTARAIEFQNRFSPYKYDDFDELSTTDPEFAERLRNFAFDEVMQGSALDDRTRFLAITATLMGVEGLHDIFADMIHGALNMGVEAIALREVIYQGVDYLGIARTMPFLAEFNNVMKERKIELPLEPQATTTAETRLEAGNAVQVEAFGEGMRESWKTCPAERAAITRWLAANCFGDYYTRGGLTLAEREMATFCYIVAQGGCEPQAVAHAMGNINVGNSKEFMYDVVKQCLPYMGYPRTLNALAAIDKAAETLAK